jgi:hypothetical protein
VKNRLLKLSLILCCLSIPTIVIAQTARDDRFTIFVGPQTRDGFIDLDSGIRDSIKDVQEALRKLRSFTVVDKADEATLLLLVVGRRSVEVGAKGTSTEIGTVTTTRLRPTYARELSTILRVGTYEKSTVTEEDSWKDAAEQVAKEVVVWAEANRERIKR